MTQNNNDNRVTITGGTVQGNLFAAGSKDFQGTINNITKEQSSKIDELTEKLISALSGEPELADQSSEIIAAVKQVRAQAKSQEVNKLSIKGIISGISMVMENAKSISTSTLAIFKDWKALFESIFQ